MRDSSANVRLSSFEISSTCSLDLVRRVQLRPILERIALNVSNWWTIGVVGAAGAEHCGGRA